MIGRCNRPDKAGNGRRLEACRQLKLAIRPIQLPFAFAAVDRTRLI
jgi:hypothetical protein